MDIHDKPSPSPSLDGAFASSLSGTENGPDRTVIEPHNGDNEDHGALSSVSRDAVPFGWADPLLFDPAKLLKRQPVIAYGDDARRMIRGKRVP